MRQTVHIVRAPVGHPLSADGTQRRPKKGRAGLSKSSSSHQKRFTAGGNSVPAPLHIALFPHTRIYRSGRNASARSVPNRTRTPADTRRAAIGGSTSQKMKTRPYPVTGRLPESPPASNSLARAGERLFSSSTIFRDNSRRLSYPPRADGARKPAPRRGSASVRQPTPQPLEQPFVAVTQIHHHPFSVRRIPERTCSTNCDRTMLHSRTTAPAVPPDGRAAWSVSPLRRRHRCARPPGHLRHRLVGPPEARKSG